MALVSTWTMVLRFGCCFSLVALAYPAFEHTKAVLVAAESARQERDLREIFQSLAQRRAIDAQSYELARVTLSSNALDSQALANAWEATAGQMSERRAFELHSIAGQVSRRSPSYLASELVAAAEADDIQRVVRAFDRMASLSPGIRPSLSKLAVPLLDDSEGARLLAKLHSRPWFSDFIASAVQEPNRLDQVAKFLNSANITETGVKIRFLNTVTTAFLEHNRVAEAQKFATSFGKMSGAELNGLDFRLQQKVLGDSLLTWQFPNATVKPIVDANGSLWISTSYEIGSQALLEKVFFFEPGRHRIEAPVVSRNALNGIILVWKISCGEIPINQVSGLIGTTDPHRKTLVLEFDAPNECSGYHLSLYMDAPSDHSSPIEISLGRLRFVAT